ncbi:MAG TPA: anthranilate phosphoribosyltransferase [Myxococcota bacterium]|jgi:anthranilate phosphoribosyltransferase|nr:anthranilate phosphoribosyltransferase [Myxococcota bacterium]
MAPAPHPRMTEYLRRVATGPRGSRPLARAEARDAMELILAGAVDPVEAGVFLVALRLKYETDDENLGVLDALRGATAAAAAGVDDLCDVADPYDGFVRHAPASPFLPAVLAACGLPAVSHGARGLPPKRGVSHADVLAAAGAATDLSPDEAARRIAATDAGWAYVDQRRACPALHALAGLRALIVKRPCLATLEKLCGPVRGRRSHLVVGWVHKGYDRLLCTLARAQGYASALAIRGVEGGVMPSLRAPRPALGYRRGEAQDTAVAIDPDAPDAAVPRTRAGPGDGGAAGAGGDVNGDGDEGEGAPAGSAAAARPAEGAAATADGAAATAEGAAAAGLAALAGAPGPARDGLILLAGAILAQAGRFPDARSAARAARTAIEDGRAAAHFAAGR